MSNKSTDARVLETGAIKHIPIEFLQVSPHNVRRVDVNDLDGLVASISEHGLLQPLVGYEAPGETDPICFVAAGQRRLLAMRKAKLTGDVPIRICTEQQAIEISLAENLERKDMNPADEVAAFKALVETGNHDASTIAKRFGLPLRHVKRRLKMGVLVPEILEALQQGKITVDAAEAYAAGDATTQLRVFKQHNRPNAWQAHSPTQILKDIDGAGIDANGRLAKFIGGVKAYKKAGGTMIAGEFDDLFANGVSERLRDMTIVRQLFEEAAAKAEPALVKAALKTAPFISGVEFYDYFGNWPKMPTPAKSTGLIAVEKGWDQTEKQLIARVKKAAEKEGAQVLAIAELDENGKATIKTDAFLVGEDGWKATKPKVKEEDRSYHTLTPEERAEREKETEIRHHMRLLFGRSLVGETPGFGVTGCAAEGWGAGQPAKLTIELTLLDSTRAAEIVDTSQYQHQIKQDVLEPFREAAIARIEELKQEAAAKTDEGLALLDEIELLPIDQFPYEVEVIVDDGEDTCMFTAQKSKDGEGNWILDCMGPDGDCWQTDNILETIDAVRDVLKEHGGTVSVVRDPPPEETATATAEPEPEVAQTTEV